MPREADTGAEVGAALRRIWARHRSTALDHVGTLEAAAAALADGRLDAVLGERAQRSAHRLAGSLGTFGLADASERARSAELLLAGDEPPPPDRAAVLAGLAAAVRTDVEAASMPVDGGADPAPTAPGRAAGAADDEPLLLVVDDDDAFAEQLAAEGSRNGMRVTCATSPSDARELLRRSSPDAVLLDLTFADGTHDAFVLLSELTAATPSVPVLVSTARDELADRVEVARRGGRSFVTKAMPPAEIVEQATRLIARRTASQITLLAVDDDPSVLDAVRELLSADGVRVVALQDPRAFWDTLEHVQPDLVLLDVDMPHVSGIELCRVLRNDARWSSVPVLVLTAGRDAAAIEAVFAAGADDYLAKPLVPPELRVRVRNRVERLRLHRLLAETDGLTGVANRSTSRHSVERLLHLAARNRQPLALALADLDRFKQVNDRHGHPAGDDVLKRFGRMLRQAFRGEDVVGRWGGEEFAIGMYGIDAAGAAARLGKLLDAFGEERFAGADGDTFRVGFSAGIAAFPADGGNLAALHAAADAALYRAKDAGRGRLRVAGDRA